MGWRVRDRGSAPVEFVLVGSLVVFLFLGVLQLALLLHMRNVVVSSVSEAAHSAARADASCRDGIARFEKLLDASLSARAVQGIRRPIRCGVEASAPGARVVRVTADVDLPLVFLPFGSVAVSASARAVQEGR